MVGDRVLTINAKTGAQVFSDVVYLPHGKNEERTIFTNIATESGRDVKMTANHVLPAGSCALALLPMIEAHQVSTHTLHQYTLITYITPFLMTFCFFTLPGVHG